MINDNVERTIALATNDKLTKQIIKNEKQWQYKGFKQTIKNFLIVIKVLFYFNINLGVMILYVLNKKNAVFKTHFCYFYLTTI